MNAKRWGWVLATLGCMVLAGCGTNTTPAAIAPGATTTAVREVATAAAPPTDETGETAVPTIDLEAPTQAVDTFLARVRDQQYAQVEPLMTDLLRDAFVQGAGSVEAGFRATDARDGKLVSYRLGTARAVSETSATVDVELESERVTTSNTVEVVNENGSWKIANIIPR